MRDAIRFIRTRHDHDDVHAAFGPWQMPRGPFGGDVHGHFPRGRARRGDVRTAILALLAERPMHGYEMIQELSGRTGGMWRPSPGSVYPTLQMLEDEGLISSQETEGKRLFSLTDTGREEAGRHSPGQAPWELLNAGVDQATLRMRDAVFQAGAAVMPGCCPACPVAHDTAMDTGSEARPRAAPATRRQRLLERVALLNRTATRSPRRRAGDLIPVAFLVQWWGAWVGRGAGRPRRADRRGPERARRSAGPRRTASWGRRSRRGSSRPRPAGPRPGPGRTRSPRGAGLRTPALAGRTRTAPGPPPSRPRRSPPTWAPAA